jgi:hypothetical protein
MGSIQMSSSATPWLAAGRQDLGGAEPPFVGITGDALALR